MLGCVNVMRIMINERNSGSFVRVRLDCYSWIWDWSLLAKLTSSAVVIHYASFFVIPIASRSAFFFLLGEHVEMFVRACRVACEGRSMRLRALNQSCSSMLLSPTIFM